MDFPHGKQECLANVSMVRSKIQRTAIYFLQTSTQAGIESLQTNHVHQTTPPDAHINQWMAFLFKENFHHFKETQKTNLYTWVGYSFGAKIVSSYWRIVSKLLPKPHANAMHGPKADSKG